jgi:L-lactate utilization protein LutB
MNGVLTESKSSGTRVSLPVFRSDFMADAHEASTDIRLQAAMDNSVTKRDMGRKTTLSELPDANALRELAGQIKRHTLDHLDYYLELK